MFRSEYRKKRISADQAAGLVTSGQWLDYGLGNTMPYSIDQALARRKGELEDVKIRGLMAMRPLAVVECDPERESFWYMSWHLSSYERGLNRRGLCDYIPMTYRSQPELYRKCLDVDVAFISVAPMDHNGCFNFSLTNSSTRALLETAKVVVLEENECLPRCYGGSEEYIHIADVDYIVRGEPVAPVTLPAAPVTDADRSIAEFIVPQLRDGSVIQLGIGALPNAVGGMIAASDLKDLGMHTELLTDAYLDIFKAGKLTNRYKTIDRHRGVFTFCAGSRELYEWAGENPLLASYPVNYTNAAEIAGRNDRLISINSCLEADLFGQVSSESTRDRQISGTGGQLDFVQGCYISNGGQSFLCMHSTFRDKETGAVKSRILPEIPGGAIVTAPRSQIHCLVTEWGIANLAGRSTWERAERVIGLAHPDFREELIAAAEKRGIWRRSNKRI